MQRKSENDFKIHIGCQQVQYILVYVHIHVIICTNTISGSMETSRILYIKLMKEYEDYIASNDNITFDEFLLN